MTMTSVSRKRGREKERKNSFLSLLVYIYILSLNFPRIFFFLSFPISRFFLFVIKNRRKMFGDTFFILNEDSSHPLPLVDEEKRERETEGEKKSYLSPSQ